MSEGMEPRLDSERHALYVGWVLGCAMRAGVEVTPVVDADGNYTDRLTVVLPDRTEPVEYIITVIVPPPPDDWGLTDEPLSGRSLVRPGSVLRTRVFLVAVGTGRRPQPVSPPLPGSIRVDW